MQEKLECLAQNVQIQGETCAIQHTFYLLPVQYNTPFTSCLCNTAHLLPLPCKYKLSLTNPENFQTNSAVQPISTSCPLFIFAELLTATLPAVYHPE